MVQNKYSADRNTTQNLTLSPRQIFLYVVMFGFITGRVFTTTVFSLTSPKVLWFFLLNSRQPNPTPFLSATRLVFAVRMFHVDSASYFNCLKALFLRFSRNLNKLFSRRGFIKFSFPPPFSNLLKFRTTCQLILRMSIAPRKIASEIFGLQMSWMFCSLEFRVQSFSVWQTLCFTFGR